MEQKPMMDPQWWTAVTGVAVVVGGVLAAAWTWMTGRRGKEALLQQAQKAFTEALVSQDQARGLLWKEIRELSERMASLETKLDERSRSQAEKLEEVLRVVRRKG